LMADLLARPLAAKRLTSSGQAFNGCLKTVLPGLHAARRVIAGVG
jgi:hypothetical protein